VKSTWITTGSTELVSGDLRSVSFSDFFSSEGYSDGSGKTLSTTLQAKIDFMTSLYEKTQNGGASVLQITNEGGSNNLTATAVLIGLSIGAGAAIAAFLKARKKDA